MAVADVHSKVPPNASGSNVSLGTSLHQLWTSAQPAFNSHANLVGHISPYPPQPQSRVGLILKSSR